MALWYCGGVVMWYYGTVVLWYCGGVVLWLCVDVPCCEVTMEAAADNQIHLSQSVPMSSPLTWKLTGDIGEEMRPVVSKTSHSTSFHLQSQTRSR